MGLLNRILGISEKEPIVTEIRDVNAKELLHKTIDLEYNEYDIGIVQLLIDLMPEYARFDYTYREGFGSSVCIDGHLVNLIGCNSADIIVMLADYARANKMVKLCKK